MVRWSVRDLAARIGAGSLLAVLAVGLVVSPARADDVDFTIPAAPGATVSGITSDSNTGVYWMVKSPTSPAIAAVQGTGAVVGDLSLQQPVTNVQALSYRNGALYIGDIGGSRSEVQVLVVQNPATGPQTATTFTLAYPDGPHDAAAMMVSPRGNIYIATTGTNPAFYRPAQAPIAGGTVNLQRVATAPDGVTDGTFLSDGQHLAVRTPIGISIIDAFTFERAALGPTADQIVGDGLTEGLEGRVLMVGYGGATPRVAAMPVPTGTVTSSPRPSATPTPTPTQPQASGSAPASGSQPPLSAAPTTAPSAASGAKGTLTAIGVAAVVAIVAGAITLVARRR